ncbi:hypothetical protein HYC85_029095 [Camellia sinensis]|uniref:Uncharacterized protein n=1 Tax=Camellia sinensis TaxID=4442 RepID=A0A7J7G0Y5_CAMSI|nr:hypothetical protein HYC85_029095 [Camellia sinensis]
MSSFVHVINVHVCARFECLKFSAERLVSGPLNLLILCLFLDQTLVPLAWRGRGEGLVDHIWHLSATFPPCRPLEVVSQLGEVAGRPPEVADDHFSYFLDIFFASRASC